MSSVLSSREKKIIEQLLKSPEGITLQEIAESLNISRRTVLRTMSSVYNWFEERNKLVTRHPSKGLSLELSDIEKKTLYADLNDERIIHYYTKKERSLYIIIELLQSNAPLKLSYFSTVLDVSEASISNDLNDVENQLKQYNITLKRKQGYGVMVIGRERDKRRALVNIMYEMLDENQLRSAVKRQIGMESEASKVTSKIRLNLLNMIDIDTITTIEEAITKSEKEMGYEFAESSYTALAVHLALALKRILNGEVITIKEDLLNNLKMQDEYIVAKQLIESLNQSLDLTIPEDEIGYLTLHLKGARYKHGLFDSNILKFNERIIGNYELTVMIKKMIKVASIETGYDLKTVDSLLIGLVDHLRPAINRMELELDIRNPLLDKIKTEYKDIFNISKQACNVLQEELDIQLPESEIGYIAMHIGSAVEQLKNQSSIETQQYNVVVTCISGIGTSKMLAERLKKEFDNLNIVDVYASTSIKNDWLSRNEIDLILSTVHFDNETVPVLTVNPLLLEHDIKQINQKLKSLTLIKHQNKEHEENLDFYDQLLTIKSYSSAIVELLDHLQIRSDLTCENYEELLDMIVSMIGDNPSQLLKDIQRREDIGRIIFEDEHVAFLHTRSDVVKHLHVGVFRNKFDIQHQGSTYDIVLVLIAPQKVAQYKLEIMGEISGRVVSEEHFLRDLRYASEHDVYTKIVSFLNQFFNKKMKRGH